MQTDNKLFDDLSKVTTSALGVLTGVKDEMEGVMRARFDRWLAGLDLVRREDFEAVKAMAAKAREENDALRERLDALEKSLKGAAKSAAKNKAPDA